MTADHETVTFAGGHIDVSHTSRKQVQRINGEVLETPVYDRAHLRIHVDGEDGFLAVEWTPAEVYALLKSVQRHCPHVEAQDMARLDDEALIGQAVTIKPGETLIIRVSDMSPLQVNQYQEHLEAMIEHAGLDLRALIVHGDELAVQQRETSAEDNAILAERWGLTPKQIEQLPADVAHWAAIVAETLDKRDADEQPPEPPEEQTP